MFLAEERGKPKERRASGRVATPHIHAFYWTGGRSKPLPLRNISENGAFVETAAEWCCGTIVHLVLESTDSTTEAPSEHLSIGLWGQVIHIASDGIGLQFIVMDRQEEKNFRRFLKYSLGGSAPVRKSRAWGGWLP